MKTMYPPALPVIATMACNLESNVPPLVIATMALWQLMHRHMMYGYTLLVPMNRRVLNKAIVVMTGRAHCFHDSIYIILILHL